MKTFSFPTCRGTLKVVAESRFAALRTFKLLVRKTKSAKYLPIAMKKRAQILANAQ